MHKNIDIYYYAIQPSLSPRTHLSAMGPASQIHSSLVCQVRPSSVCPVMLSLAFQVMPSLLQASLPVKPFSGQGPSSPLAPMRPFWAFHPWPAMWCTAELLASMFRLHVKSYSVCMPRVRGLEGPVYIEACMWVQQVVLCMHAGWQAT